MAYSLPGTMAERRIFKITTRFALRNIATLALLRTQIVEESYEDKINDEKVNAILDRWTTNVDFMNNSYSFLKEYYETYNADSRIAELGFKECLDDVLLLVQDPGPKPKDPVQEQYLRRIAEHMKLYSMIDINE
jgi:hypothetical protein